RLMISDHWNVLAFRVLIALFYLRRTRESVWNGQWLVDRQVAHPVPWEILPKSDQWSEEAARKMYHRTGTRRETMAMVIERADKHRLLAKTSVYAKVDETLEKMPRTSQGQKQMEEIIKRRIRYEKTSGRLQRLVALIKEIKTTWGELYYRI